MFFTKRFLDRVGPDFLRDRLGQDFARAELGADQVADLLTWDALNHILSTHQLSAPQLRLFRDGTQVPTTSYTPRSAPPPTTSCDWSANWSRSTSTWCGAHTKVSTPTGTTTTRSSCSWPAASTGPSTARAAGSR